MSTKSRLAPPDFAEVGNPFDRQGRVWIRNLAMKCPYCRDTFFTYQLRDEPEMPGQYSREPRIIDGMPNGRRQTCGGLPCEARSEQDYLAANQAYQRANAEYAAKRNTPEPTKQKANGLKKL